MTNACCKDAHMLLKVAQIQIRDLKQQRDGMETTIARLQVQNETLIEENMKLLTAKASSQVPPVAPLRPPFPLNAATASSSVSSSNSSVPRPKVTPAKYCSPASSSSQAIVPKTAAPQRSGNQPLPQTLTQETPGPSTAPAPGAGTATPDSKTFLGTNSIGPWESETTEVTAVVLKVEADVDDNHGTVQCQICDPVSEFDNLRQLQQHMEALHRQTDFTQRTFHCCFCKNVFSTRSDIVSHYLNTHKRGCKRTSNSAPPKSDDIDEDQGNMACRRRSQTRQPPTNDSATSQEN